MHSKNSGRAPKGSVGIESFRGLLRIRLPRHLYGGKQKYLSTDLADTDINLTIDEPLIVKQKLEQQVTTIYRTKDGLMYLAAACRWGKKHKLVAANLFEGVAQELPQ